jgi:uncharacterized surface protein with fasciclin (FAS1) repeats
MSAQLKKMIVGMTLGALMIPVVAACSGQNTTQVPPTTTEPVPDATTTPVSPAPGVPGTPGSGEQSTARNVVDLIDNNPSLKTLASTIDEADLQTTLEQGGPYTIFAPSDRAFAALPAATRQRLLKDENRALLRQILTYHVVPGSITSSQLKSGQVKTQSGSSVNVQVNGTQVKVNQSQVIQPDLQAANGVVHIVDRILLPPNIKL